MTQKAVLWAALALAGAAPSSGEDYAVAVKLPRQAMSFWKIGEPVAWGVELSGRYQHSDFLPPSERTKTGWWARGDLSRMRPWRTEGTVSPFWMSGLGGWISANSILITSKGTRRTEWQTTKGLLCTAGAGVAWRPLDQAALWFRYRLDLAFQNEEKRLNTFTLETRRPEVLAVFRW